ncbi:uncharacterized protein V6R79_023072 [Siganus canaliculatus]
MSCSLPTLWRANLLFFLGLFWSSGEATVLTEAQIGPLYRVVGSSLSIFCNVSGFKDADARKEFEFRIRKPSNPTFEINIISSSDGMFSYAVFSQRVRNKEITLTHTSPNSVIFEMQNLQKSDEGEYECSVINSEKTYSGTYSAPTIVKVIDNSLSVSTSASTPLSVNEGDALTLTCQASSNTIQHTHLSLAWYLHKNDVEDARPVISLNRDFTLSPGHGFEERYEAGLIKLDKIGEATYKLSMAQLELSDQGKIYCQAQEWIQDPDRSWYSLAQKAAEETTLNVKAKEIVSDTTSLIVGISAQPSSLHEGQELTLNCNVDTQNLEEKFLSVAWVKGGVELARIGPTGILSVGPDYKVREGELRAARTGDKDYRLVLQPVRTEDQGEYFCRAWPQERGQHGVFSKGAATDSDSQSVSISATESGLSLEMQESLNVNEGNRLKLSCKVHGVKGQLSVTWQRKAPATSTSAFAKIISLSQEGVTEKVEGFLSRQVQATRPAADTFTLELDEITPSDSGIYQCTVSEWKSSSKTNSQSVTATVTVLPIDSLVKVNLISRNSQVSLGESMELMCRVRGPRVPVTLTWSLQHEDSSVDTIVTLYHHGEISWSGGQHRYQLRVQNPRENEVFYYLLIKAASQRESGSYQCAATVFLDNVNKKLNPSNPLAVTVQKPVSKLTLMSIPTLTSPLNADIEIKCSVMSEPSASSRYAVTWLLQRQAENKTIVSSDWDALVTFGAQVEPGLRQRVSTKRTKGPSFEMALRQAQISDQGLYICEVVEWRQDPHGDWYQLSPVSKSTKILITKPASDLHLNQTEQSLTSNEGDEVALSCSITSGASNPSFVYNVSWFYNKPGSSDTNRLVELDHRGLLTYPEKQELSGLQGRLRLSRPTQSSFYLLIHKAHEEDSGTYECHVEQYQLDLEGNWQRKDFGSARPITLTINVPENKLSIPKEEVELNVTMSRNFTIPCYISKQSSLESHFQVTWFRQKEPAAEQQPIFTAYRNSTLQNRLRKKSDQLIFSHPSPNLFNLTVLNSDAADSGLYFCEVEEWLPSLTHGWRKAAVEKSGNLTVHVSEEGEAKAISEPTCQSGLWIGILVAVVICALLVIAFLVKKTKRKKGGNKSENSLWAEDVNLNGKPSAED